MDIRSAQRLAWDNKNAKGFNITELPLEFCFLQGEVAEAFQAWRRQRDDLGEELADIALHLMSVATMAEVDLQVEVEQKIRKNAARAYAPDPRSGVLVRVAEGIAPSGVDDAEA